MLPIAEIAEKMGLDPKVLIPQGHYKAKVPLDAIKQGGSRGKPGGGHGHHAYPRGRGQDDDHRRADPGARQAGQTRRGDAA